MRKARARGVKHHQVVFSPEPPMEPEQLEAPPGAPQRPRGSLVWVPASGLLGRLLCQHVVTELIRTENNRQELLDGYF